MIVESLSVPPSASFVKLDGVYFSFSSLPFSITSLHLHDNCKIGLNSPLFPPSLTELDLRCSFNHPIHLLPSSLEIDSQQFIQLMYSHNQNIDRLPSSLQILKLGMMYDQPILHFPPSLLLSPFHHNLHLIIPSNTYLTHTLLKLGSYFNHPFSKLPPKLTLLHSSKYSI